MVLITHQKALSVTNHHMRTSLVDVLSFGQWPCAMFKAQKVEKSITINSHIYRSFLATGTLINWWCWPLFMSLIYIWWKKRGKNLCLHQSWMTCIHLSLSYCLLKRLESFLVAEETHKPEIKIIYSNYFYVLLWWLLRILTLVGCPYLS